ncbi:hypothetical protein LINGRAHAP2_LOCUS9599 [Linum grandiflorum]
MVEWKKIVHPVRRVWKGVTVRLKSRKKGLNKLQQDVKASKYNDVHVMWDMLKGNQEGSKKSKSNHSSWKHCG